MCSVISLSNQSCGSISDLHYTSENHFDKISLFAQIFSKCSAISSYQHSAVPAPPPLQMWLAAICRQFAATCLPLTPAPAPRSRDLDTGLWLVSAGHVTWMLVSDWSRVWPSQHRSQLWAEKRAPAKRIPVSIWAETGDHRVSSECQLEKWRLSSTEEEAELSIISRGLKIIWRTVRARCQHHFTAGSVKYF